MSFRTIRLFGQSAPTVLRMVSSQSAGSCSFVSLSRSLSTNVDSNVRLWDVKAAVPDTVSPTISLQNANQQQITKFRVQEAIGKIQRHKSDTGSSAVQIAAMTEKIKSLALHFAKHKKDKHSMRGFQILVARRRKLMQYMKRTDFDGFVSTVDALELRKEASKLK